MSDANERSKYEDEEGRVKGLIEGITEGMQERE